MTYKQLREKLDNLTDEQLNMTTTILISGEYYSATEFFNANEDDTPGHPYSDIFPQVIIVAY